MAPAERFDRCLLVVNPSGSSYRRSLKLRGSLERVFAGQTIHTLRLTKDEISRPTRLRRELRKLNNRSLLAVIGGDGTVNLVINELLALSHNAPKKATILPLWGGNASDLAHMCNGRRRNSVHQILRRGHTIEMHPLEYRLAQGSEHRTGFAMCYLSFGSVAQTQHAYDNSRLIKLTARIPVARLVSEVFVGTLALAKAKHVRIAPNRKLYDIIFLNGPRIAKLYRAPVKLDRKGYLELIITHKHPVMATHGLNLALTWLRQSSPRTRSEFTVLTPAWLQYDGEVSRLKGETAVRVKSARQSVYLLTTK